MDSSKSSHPQQKTTAKILCRYFMNGACREKENCRYSHSLADQPSSVCTYYQLGNCSYGKNCRYDHTKPKRSNVVQKTNCLSSTSTLPVTSQGRAVSNLSQVLKKSSAPAASHLVTLSKSGDLTAESKPLELTVVGLPSTMKADDWIKAAEFVPGQKWRGLSGPSSYLEAAQTGTPTTANDLALLPQHLEMASTGLCPFAVHDECPYGDSCEYIHGDICELCKKAVLMPYDEDQNRKHTETCMSEHERSMKAAFAAQESENKVCGICMEVVWEKTPATAKRFGILSDCTHVFCLACIRKWRAEGQYENEVIRACPECRVKSDFVIPSNFWVESKEDKIRLIDTYKAALSKKPCMHFNFGNGECPFNSSCFYDHSYPDGTKASPRRPRKQINADGEVTVAHHPSLWDFLNAANERRMELGNLLMDAANDDELLSLTSLQMHDFPLLGSTVAGRD